jgi:hypothetical protein
MNEADRFWEHGPLTRTMNICNAIQCHWHPRSRFHWKALALLALFLVDEFLCGRLERICLIRCELESRWFEYM